MGQSGNFALKELHPLDLHAAQNIILKHRTQLEEMNHRVQKSKDALEALEECFGTDNCTFVYRDKNGYPLASDYNTLVLLAATRDGQREVITTIKKILNS